MPPPYQCSPALACLRCAPLLTRSRHPTVASIAPGWLCPQALEIGTLMLGRQLREEQRRSAHAGVDWSAYVDLEVHLLEAVDLHRCAVRSNVIVPAAWHSGISSPVSRTPQRGLLFSPRMPQRGLLFSARTSPRTRRHHWCTSLQCQRVAAMSPVLFQRATSLPRFCFRWESSEGNCLHPELD